MTVEVTGGVALTPSGPVQASTNGQIIEGLDITASGNTAGIRINGRSDVVVRNCRIRHASGRGIHATSSPRLLIEDVDILCTGAPGILERRDDPRSLVSYTDLPGLRRLEKSGSLEDGMLPKAAAIESAIRGGVRRVHVISYNARDSVLAEVFTNEGTGTMIVADVKALTPAEQHPEGAGKP